MPSDSEDVATVRDLTTQFFAALGRGDVSAIEDLHTADAAILAPNRRIVQGADTATFWRGVAPRFEGAQSNVVSVDIIGGMVAREIGRFRFKPQRADGQPIVFKFLMLWQKVDGAWKLSSMVWNLRENEQQQRQKGVYAAT
jgi:ketosteroid isomerase-like protein